MYIYIISLKKLILAFFSLFLSLFFSLEEKEPASLKYPHGLHKYINLENQVLFCDIRDPHSNEFVTFNTDKYLSVHTHGGVRQVTPELWSTILEKYKPDLFTTMPDIICDKDAKTKRIKRSVDRTLRWLDQCLPKAKVNNNNKIMMMKIKASKLIFIYSFLLGNRNTYLCTSNGSY